VNKRILSEEFKSFIFNLGMKPDNALDWKYPPNPLLWTKKEEEESYKKAHEAHKRLLKN